MHQIPDVCLQPNILGEFKARNVLFSQKQNVQPVCVLCVCELVTIVNEMILVYKVSQMQNRAERSQPAPVTYHSKAYSEVPLE